MNKSYSRRYTCSSCSYKGRVSNKKVDKYIICPVCGEKNKAKIKQNNE